MKPPKGNAKLCDIIEFYLVSPAFARLSGASQKDYEIHLASVINTPVEGRSLGEYRCTNLKVRHLIQAYDIWLQTGIRTANYRKSVLSAAWKYSMRQDVMIHNPVALVPTKSSKPRRVYWSRDQIKTFLETGYSDFRWRSISLIVHMAYDWGQRIGDMRVMTWDTLDLDQCLRLTSSLTYASMTKVSTLFSLR